MRLLALLVLHGLFLLCFGGLGVVYLTGLVFGLYEGAPLVNFFPGLVNGFC